MDTMLCAESGAELGAKSLTAQFIALVPQGKQCQLSILQVSPKIDLGDPQT